MLTIRIITRENYNIISNYKNITTIIFYIY